MRGPRGLPNLPLFLLVLLLIPLATTDTISIAQYSGLLQQRNCVYTCIVGSGLGGHQDLQCAIGCQNANSCLCREDLRPTASSYLSSCIYTDFPSCSDAPDYSAAVSIYDNYCNLTEPATVIVTPTSTSALNTAVNDVVTVTTTGGPTVTATMTSSSSSILSPSSSSEFPYPAVSTNFDPPRPHGSTMPLTC
ncbi:uncharacterized protein K441DRAFT_650126 [Cenococcum geophilum 1.58]|uniref:uncharacterized protein n=1 Tax=Cenococcum geophilum 1.58 TaxID=794803 RepID=UPI00358FB316|nr:hypothetical protein K441DRAFT_650126 [Cenococcum geophilum 1.58]